MKFPLLALGLLATTAVVASATFHTGPMPWNSRGRLVWRFRPTYRPPPREAPFHGTQPSPPFWPVLFSLARPFVPADEKKAVSPLSPSAAVTAPPDRMSATAAKAAIEADGYKGSSRAQPWIGTACGRQSDAARPNRSAVKRRPEGQGISELTSALFDAVACRLWRIFGEAKMNYLLAASLSLLIVAFGTATSIAHDQKPCRTGP
jgi:hypothetical protein